MEGVDLAAIAGVLLDMDGTLVDSDASVERSWRTWAHAYGVDPAAVLAIAHGCPAQRTVARLLPDLDPARAAAAAQHQLALQYDDLSDVAALPGAHALLEALERRGLPWAIVTSADRRLALARLGAAGIEPRILVTCEEVTNGKPDPECFLLGARRLGVDAASCLVVEDSEPGLAAGRAAGATTAALRGLRGDLCLRDLFDLVDAVSASSRTRRARLRDPGPRRGGA